ncbi:MAG: hypothetical protein IT373_17905 [Polyangiaceae bacterium]|nr:hypothetical protein [Polyangiaceae bacterium]
MTRAVAALLAVTALAACARPGQVEAELRFERRGLPRRVSVLCRLGLGLAADARGACASPAAPDASSSAAAEAARGPALGLATNRQQE